MPGGSGNNCIDDPEESSEEYHWKWISAVFNSINGRTCMPKDIFNLVEDIRILTFSIQGIRIEYYHKLINRDAYRMADLLTSSPFDVIFAFSLRR